MPGSERVSGGSESGMPKPGGAKLGIFGSGIVGSPGMGGGIVTLGSESGRLNPGGAKLGIFGRGIDGNPGIGGGMAMAGSPGIAGSGKLHRDIHGTNTLSTGFAETKPAPTVPVIGATASGVDAPTPRATEPAASDTVGAETTKPVFADS